MPLVTCSPAAKPTPNHDIMTNGRFIPSRLSLLRILLALASVAVLLWLAPRADHQSFSYELNQPWKYPLLTAEFDMPILRDSASARKMRDSIDAKFVPFVERRAGGTTR